MSLRIDIADDKLEYLTADAKEELKNSIVSYSDGIIKEAGRIEGSIRDDNERPEITRKLIRDAVQFQKSPYKKTTIATKFRIIQLVSVVTLFFSGIMFDFDAFQTNPTLIVLFLLTAGAAIISTSYIYLGRDD